MTQDFDALALKVAGEVWANLNDEDESVFCLALIEFARRLREEWLKGMEPVAWMNETDDAVWFELPPSINDDAIPLYALETK